MDNVDCRGYWTRDWQGKFEMVKSISRGKCTIIFMILMPEFVKKKKKGKGNDKRWDEPEVKKMENI